MRSSKRRNGRIYGRRLRRCTAKTEKTVLSSRNIAASAWVLWHPKGVCVISAGNTNMLRIRFVSTPLAKKYVLQPDSIQNFRIISSQFVSHPQQLFKFMCFWSKIDAVAFQKSGNKRTTSLRNANLDAITMLGSLGGCLLKTPSERQKNRPIWYNERH